MAFHPHRFGRYIIVDPIAVGGMAEIYRARVAASKEGPDRVIVIKKVIANLQQNEEFLQMFEEEIKITVGLTHPNIIQIYDYGQAEEQYFMAMEYVEGKNLRQFVKRLADMKSMFSIDMSCHIISNVCHALAYAHSYRDRMSGKPLGIVHRDISPQNVMISYDGAVKLFDFGIAKAKSASEATRAGVIKGKPSYLSPEQINGEELDGRSDIFALGIVLWELLTAKRLFVAETDMGVLRLIQSAKIEPPSTFNPAVPAALDAIVLKSLHRDRTKRYQGSEEFQRDLHKFLYSFNPNFNPADLAYYAQELFKNEIRDDRERLHKFLSMDPIEASGAPGGAPIPGGGPPKKAEAPSTKLADGLMSTTDFNREMMDSVAGTGSINRPSDIQLASSIQMAQPRTVNLTQGTGTRAGMPGGAPPLPTGRVNAPPGAPAGPGARRNTESMVIPPWSKQTVGSGGTPRAGTSTATALRKEIDNQSSGGGRNVMVLMAVLVAGGLFAGRQYDMFDGTPLKFLSKTRVIEVVDAPAPTASRPLASDEAPRAVPVSANEGVIILQTKVTGYKVFVNDREAGLNNNQFAVPLNTDVRIDVVKPGYQTQRFATKVTGSAPVAFRVELIAIPSGTLYFSTTPDAQVTLYRGEEKIFEGHTPIRNEVVPAGHYKAVLENSLLGFREEMDLVIEEGKLSRVERTITAK
ncbi:MAG: serine/threonine protein kinase [Proteobacteria bacterium]|nr:MAG: serine/threonine protein kinase [Pseudomonadota bacterium]